MNSLPFERLSVLFVNYNSWQLCSEAVTSLAAVGARRADGSPMPLEVIVVDNASPMRDAAGEAALEQSLAGLDGDHSGRLIRHEENGGYAKGMNLAYSHASGDGILICNPDLVFQDGCVDALLRKMESDPAVGAAAPEGFWDPTLTGRLPPNILPTMGDLLRLFAASLSRRMVRSYAARRSRAALPVWTAEHDVDLPMLSGCCFLMRRAVIEQIGLFDERFPLYYEDTDLSMRIFRAGLRIVQVHRSQIVHLYNQSGQTANELAMQRYYISRRLYYRKYYGWWGALLYDGLRWVQRRKFAAARAARIPWPQVHDLGAHKGPPRIQFDRSYRRFVVELALDPYFYLAAGIFGSGDSWTVNDTLFHSFGPTTYYFRVLDISGDSPQLIGIYRYVRIAIDAPEPENVPTEAEIG